MTSTEPTRATKTHLREQASLHAQLKRACRERGISFRRKLHSDAFEAGTIAPLGSDELRQEITAVSLLRAVREAVGS